MGTHEFGIRVYFTLLRRGSLEMNMRLGGCGQKNSPVRLSACADGLNR
jgi:hypothetical protein